MRRWREEDRKLVIETLSEGADGMFRWVYCQLEALRDCLPPRVRRNLEELSDALDETYRRVLREINEANRVEELAEVLAMDFDAPAHGGISQLNPDWRWTDHHQAVLSICSSLFAIIDGDQGSQVVQFSVKEYLTSDRLSRSSGDISRHHIFLEPAGTILAQACLGVLLRLDDRVNREDVREIPLVEYMARYLFDHARFEDYETRWNIFDTDKPR